MQFVQLDSYGGCLRNKQDLMGRYGSANGKNFKQLKTELARKYKFTPVFFNQDCDYFVDDQISHALSAGSVPVVMSTDKLEEFLPSNLRQPRSQGPLSYSLERERTLVEAGHVSPCDK